MIYMDQELKLQMAWEKLLLAVQSKDFVSVNRAYWPLYRLINPNWKPKKKENE